MRIHAVSYTHLENNDIGLADLRYLKVLHYNFNGNVQVGEVIVNAQLAEDFLSAFKSLYEEHYEIQSMYLIDNYWTGAVSYTHLDVYKRQVFLFWLELQQRFCFLFFIII